jgi:glyoxylase-like metal-dependent hydrolase (beta-lactamase superfamily II)
MARTTSLRRPNRRRFLTTLAGGTAGLLWSQRGLAQTTAPPLTATKLAANLIEISGDGGNISVLTSPEGTLMVDGGLPDRSAELLRLVAEQTNGRPVRVLFNTHWHLDHTGSNETLGTAGARIIAHHNTKRWLSSRVYVEAQQRTYQPRPAEAIPTQEITAPGKMTFGGETIEYGPLAPAHTNGDIYVFFPASNVLMVSDVLSVGRYPIMDYSTGGWIGGMIDATTTLLKIGDANTRIVPGTGPLQTRQDLQAEHDMLGTVKDRVQTMIRQGKGISDILAEKPTKEFDEKWGKPDQFLSMTVTGLFRHTHEIGGIL